MKLAVLGATGQTGLQVVSQALDAGHTVTAYVRQPGALPTHDDLTVVIGQLVDARTMTTAFEGADAVISCLGPEPGLATAFKQLDLMTTVVPAIMASMRAAGVRRLVLMSALGVGESKRKTAPFARFLYSTYARTVYADKLRAENMLTTSELDWTLVYPGVLTSKPTPKAVKVTELAAVTKIPGLPEVSRPDVAAFLLDAATTGSGSRSTLVVTT